MLIHMQLRTLGVFVHREAVVAGGLFGGQDIHSLQCNSVLRIYPAFGGRECTRPQGKHLLIITTPKFGFINF